MLKSLARLRVPLGFVCAAAAIALAHPTISSLTAGFFIAAIGEALRVWASGHIDKGREVTRTGPYRFVRHPLYFGSTIMGVGFMVAAMNVLVAAIVTIYLAVTLWAAMRTEETTLDARFSGEYSDYRAGRAAPVARAFSWQRVGANKEYRAIVGFVIGMALLYWRATRFM
jgi:protein-S-isoprenylcysteine O-methyltransferase Ste14